GNIATPEAVRELENAGADATKVGIGPGRACITKLKTGFGTGGWQLAALRMCSKAARKPLIADGGIRHNGDIAKSVRFGASMVMIGSLFAGHLESPGNIITIDNKTYKQYWGSASAVQKGAYNNVEGKQLLVPYRGSIKDTLKEMQEDLQSAISYAGGKDLHSIRVVDYVIVKSSIMNGDK
ncbi:MAG: GMP reductase, partial [Lactobacillus iners]|nr:GMP reductase [Lactobacillus iners]